LTLATAGPLLRIEEVIAGGKIELLRRKHRKKRALKKRLLEERGALEVLGVSYKRRLVLRGGVEVIIAEKVARLKHVVVNMAAS
jgi:hypothetical protein